MTEIQQSHKAIVIDLSAIREAKKREEVRKQWLQAIRNDRRQEIPVEAIEFPPQSIQK